MSTAGLPARVNAHVGKLVIVEARALQLPIREREPERLHEMQARSGIGAQPDHVARVRGNLGVDEDDVDHRVQPAGSGVRASAQTLTRPAPAALSSHASASAVAPVVITSSTMATSSPASASA